MSSSMKISLIFLVSLVLVTLNTTVNAGSLTQTGFDQASTVEDLKSRVPEGANITGTNCEKIGMPSGGANKYRCTVNWN